MSTYRLSLMKLYASWESLNFTSREDIEPALSKVDGLT